MQNRPRMNTEVRLQKLKTSYPDHQQSPYVVNNSLPCALMPKRASINVKAFLQMHRKLLRKKIIEKTFHSSLNQLATQTRESPKGFKGSTTTSYRFYKSSRDERIKPQSFFIDSPSTTISHPFSESRGKQTQHSHLRPNMNINLNLFKKTHKRPVLKNEHLGYKLIQNLSQTHASPTSRPLQQRSTKSYTVA